MRKFLLLMFTLLLNLQSAFAFNVDKFIDHKVAPITNFIASLVFYPVKICGYDVPIIIFWILFAGIFFTFYFKGVSILGLKHSIDVLRQPSESGDGSGEVSSYHALATALSGTIGIGCIAGVAISSALMSCLTGLKVRSDTAMTGEITLTGKVLPIGGLKEKLLAALRGNIKNVLIPKENVKDLEKIPDKVKKEMKIIPIETIEEAFEFLLVEYKKNKK